MRLTTCAKSRRFMAWSPLLIRAVPFARASLPESAGCEPFLETLGDEPPDTALCELLEGASVACWIPPGGDS